jgi:hypothetical protein
MARGESIIPDTRKRLIRIERQPDGRWERVPAFSNLVGFSRVKSFYLQFPQI